MNRELRSEIEQFVELLAKDRPTEVDLDGLRMCLERTLHATTEGESSADDTGLLRDDIVGEITRLIRGSEMLQCDTACSNIDDLIRHLKRATAAELLRFRDNAKRNFARLCRCGRRPLRSVPTRPEY